MLKDILIHLLIRIAAFVQIARERVKKSVLQHVKLIVLKDAKIPVLLIVQKDAKTDVKEVAMENVKMDAMELVSVLAQGIVAEVVLAVVIARIGCN